MRIRVFRQRGRPIYLSSAGRVVSLVPEARLRIVTLPSWLGLELQLLSPSALFVIDDRGVMRLSFTPGRRTILTLFAFLALGPLFYWFATRKT